MKRILMTAALISALLLTGCSTASNSTPDSSASGVVVSDEGALQAPADGFDDADSAYYMYLRSLGALNKDVYKALFNASEKDNAEKVTADTLGLNEIGYNTYQERVKRYDEWVDAYFSSLEDSMTKNGSAASIWTPTIGKRIKVPEDTVKKLAEETGVNIEEAVQFDTFSFKDTNSGGTTSITGKEAGAVKIDGRWYPSVIFEMMPTVF